MTRRRLEFVRHDAVNHAGGNLKDEIRRKLLGRTTQSHKGKRRTTVHASRIE